MESVAWTEAMKYRSRLVHEQPPLVRGLGISHRRQRRWRKAANGGYYLPFGGGDPPEFNTAALISTCREALVALLSVWDACVREFLEILCKKGGIVLKDGTLHIPDYYGDQLRRQAPGSQSPPSPDDESRVTQQPKS